MILPLSSSHSVSVSLEPFSFAVCQGDRVLLQSLAAGETAAAPGTRPPRPGLRVSLGPACPWRRAQIAVSPLANEATTRGKCVCARRPLVRPGRALSPALALEPGQVAESELLTSDDGGTGLLSVQTPAWLCSTGVTVLAQSPVAVGVNAPRSLVPAPHLGPRSRAGPFRESPFAEPGGQGDGRLTLRDLTWRTRCCWRRTCPPSTACWWLVSGASRCHASRPTRQHPSARPWWRWLGRRYPENASSPPGITPLSGGLCPAT